MKWLTGFLQRRRDSKDKPVDFSRSVHTALSTLDGQIVTEYLVETILIAPSYVPGVQGGKCCDTAYHEGQRALVKLLLDERDNWNKAREEMAETR